MLFAIAFFGALLLIPLYYQTVRGASALEAGLLLVPQGLGAMITMPLAGKLTDRYGRADGRRGHPAAGDRDPPRSPSSPPTRSYVLLCALASCSAWGWASR